MNVKDYSVKSSEDGFEISVIATSPSLGWTNIELCVINHQSPQSNATQEIILEGLPPHNNLQLMDAEEHKLTVFVKKHAWIKKINIRNSLGDILKTIKISKKNTILDLHLFQADLFANKNVFTYKDMKCKHSTLH